MAVSRFQNPAQYRPESLYVPAPIEYLQNNLDLQQQAYDINKQGEQSFLEQLTKIKGRSEDLPALKNISNAYENALNSIAEKVNRDYGSSNYRQELQRLSNNLRTDLAQGDLSAIGANYNTYQAYQKQLQENKNDYAEYRDQQYTKIAPGFYSGYKNMDGSYNISTLGGINKPIQREQVADSIVKGINSIGGVNVSLTKDAAGNDVITTDRGEYISPDKIRATFRPAFQNSEAYRDIVEEANFNETVARRQGRDFDKQAFIQSTVQQLENSVVSKYTKSSADRDVKFHDLSDDQRNAATTGSVTTSSTEIYDNPALNTALPKIEFNERGEVKARAFGGYSGGGISYSPGGGLQSYQKTGVDEEKKKADEDFIRSIKESNPQLAGMPDKQAYDSYAQAVTNNSRKASSTAEINNERIRESYSNKVFKGGINTRGISVIASNASNTKAMGLNDISKDLGLGKDELKDQLTNGRVTGFVNGEKPGMFKTTVIDKDGRPVTLAIEGDKEQQTYFTRSYNMTKFERENKTGKDKFVDPVDNTPYVVETMLVQDPDGQWRFRTAVSVAQNDKKGDFRINTATAPITNFDAVLRDDANRFLTSPFAEKLK